MKRFCVATSLLKRRNELVDVDDEEVEEVELEHPEQVEPEGTVRSDEDDNDDAEVPGCGSLSVMLILSWFSVVVVGDSFLFLAGVSPKKLGNYY